MKRPNKAELMRACNKNFWNLLRSQHDPNAADLYIYGDVEGDYYDWWSGEEIKSETSSEHFREELEKLGDIEQINIYINSKGGEVMEGVGIYTQLLRHPAHKTVHIDGYACSVASVIAMAGDEIIISPAGTMMIHPAWAVVSGNATELRAMADALDKITDCAINAYTRRVSVSEEEIRAMVSKETWLTSKECIEYGFADKILGDEKSEREAEDEKNNDPDKEDTPDEGDDPDGDEKPDKENGKTDFEANALDIIGKLFM